VVQVGTLPGVQPGAATRPGAGHAALVELDTRPLRVAGAAMLATAAVLPAVAHGPALCPLRAMTGVPCPFCGMTRGVVDAVHGDVGGSLLMNPGALLLVAAAVLLVLGVIRGRVTFPRWALVAGIAALWSFQLVKYATGLPL
jgi:hypothetical protein